MSETSVTTLIQGLKKGDHEAVEQLWIRYYDKLVALANKKMGSAPRRVYNEEDLAASVFESLCRGAERGNFAKLTDRHDLWALLLTITNQKKVNRVRYNLADKRGKGMVRGESVFENAAQASSGDFGIAQMVKDEPTPDLLVDMEDQLERLLELLPDERMRRIVTLRMQGYTVKEIAEDFGFVTRWAERKLQLIRELWMRELKNYESS